MSNKFSVFVGDPIKDNRRDQIYTPFTSFLVNGTDSDVPLYYTLTLLTHN